jgi:hypothetical protein
LIATFDEAFSSSAIPSADLSGLRPVGRFAD